MEAFQILLPYYLIPAGLIIAACVSVSLLLQRPRIFPAEYVAWLFPGITYWLLFEPLHLEQAFAGKTLANLIEPIVIGVLCGILFGLRVLVGATNPRLNKVAALWFLGLSNVVALAVFVLMPNLPE